MAKLFNKYFNDIGKNLAGKLKSSNLNMHKLYFDKSVSDSLFLNPSTPTKIYNVISSLKTPNQADMIRSLCFLEGSSNALAAPLSYLFNFLF